jgi:hypothetical protein
MRYLRQPKIIGPISGLLTGAFLILDRYIKHFPFAVIVARPLMPGSRNVEILSLREESQRPPDLAFVGEQERGK